MNLTREAYVRTGDKSVDQQYTRHQTRITEWPTDDDDTDS